MHLFIVFEQTSYRTAVKYFLASSLKTILIPQGFCKHADAKTKLDKYVCQEMQQLFLPERSSCVFSKRTILPNVCLKWSLMTSTKCFPKQKFKGKSVWYSTVPLGHKKLNSMVKIMMSEAGVEGYYTNHSLRATAVSRLF